MFHQLSGALNDNVSRLDQVVATDLKQLNEQLTARKLTPVIAK